MIKYGISREYLPDWGIQEALREIYQNFDDFGDCIQETRERGYDVEVTLCNDYVPENLNFLSVGNSAKRYDSTTVGEHGEGLKMALLVLARERCDTHLSFKTSDGNSVCLEPSFYFDDNLGECFCLKDSSKYNQNKFTLVFKIPKKELEFFEGVQIDPEEIIFSNDYGEIIKKEPGAVYVGGIYIATLKDMKYAYNFKPEYINLDRDRKVPRAYDVEWTASKILQDWDGLEVDDLDKRDASYIDKIPTCIKESFKPELVNNQVVFRCGGIQANYYLDDQLKTFHKKTISTMKRKSNRTRKPENILKKFFEKYKYSFNIDQKIDFEAILEESKKWIKK